MIKHYKFVLSLAITLSCYFLPARAQNHTLLTIGSHEYSADEFNYIYNKNHSITQNPLSKKDYLPLFVNYKLKVLEAIDQGYDTLPSFRKEFNYYRDELCTPYLSDQKATEEVVQEAYEHLCHEINACHILIKLPQDASPADTLEAYNQLTLAKTQIKDLPSFEQKAREISQCPSAAQGGHLGYFTAFMMVYPFEKAAYETEPGQVSDIVRSPFGYHLIYVRDKRKNQGEIKVAHIMKAYPQNAPQPIRDKAHASIDSIYSALQNGADFDSMVRQYSDDRNSVNQNGELPWFTSGRMVPEFSEAAFALSDNGQISEPVQTPFGWHIIKRIDTKPIKSLEESQEDILSKIKRDERAFAGQKATLAKLRAEYHYLENKEVINHIKNITLDSHAQSSDALAEKIMASPEAMATFADQQIYPKDFTSYLLSGRTALSDLDEEKFQSLWTACADQCLLDYEKSILEDKYPDFRYLMNEYHDGLLIFEISQKQIWNKATEDSTGLKAYFKDHKSRYDLKERFEGYLFFCSSKKKARKVKAIIQSQSFPLSDSIKKEISTLAKIEEGEFLKGDIPMLDQQIWNAPKVKSGDQYPCLVTLGELKAEEPRELHEVRGQVLSDYQNFLEEEWIKSLREKYKPVVNTTALQ